MFDELTDLFDKVPYAWLIGVCIFVLVAQVILAFIPNPSVQKSNNTEELSYIEFRDRYALMAILGELIYKDNIKSFIIIIPEKRMYFSKDLHEEAKRLSCFPETWGIKSIGTEKIDLTKKINFCSQEQKPKKSDTLPLVGL